MNEREEVVEVNVLKQYYSTISIETIYSIERVF